MRYERRANNRMPKGSDVDTYLRRCRGEVDAALERWFPGPPDSPALAIDAMRYSVFAGGKRLRPLLTLAAAETAGTAPPDAARELALPAACAMELIHTYSLIHDDLPAMDDDSLRRGRPTSHVVYGEGLAILAGDGLLTESFRVLAERPATDDPEVTARKLRVIGRTAIAAGVAGMVGGQVLDLHAAGQVTVPADSDLPTELTLDADALRAMHARKTGALFRASATAGAIMAGASDADVDAVEEYARRLGLGFQIVDDILDVEGAPDELGKTAGKDAAAGEADVSVDVRARPVSAYGRDGDPGGQGAARTGCPDRPSRGHRGLGADTQALMTSKGRPRVRLDVLVVERGLADTRARARALILAGRVAVDGVPVSKAGTPIHPDVDVTLATPDHPYVGRGGVKLAHALDTFGISVADRRALDIGASTGGFTDVLLQRGVRHVIALDVGHGQLAWRLRQHPRVTVLEGINARNLRRDMLPDGPIQLITVDVSFISLKLILTQLPPLLEPGDDLVALVKPQFEAGRAEVGKHGVVRDPSVRRRVVDEVAAVADQLGLEPAARTPSPITGTEGNEEIFLHLVSRHA